MNIRFSLIAHLNDNTILLLCYRISSSLTNIQGSLDSQSLAVRRPGSMSWLTLCVVVQFCVSQINSVGHTPHPYVKGILSLMIYTTMFNSLEYKGHFLQIR